jgi:ribosomal protein L21E
MAAEKTVPDLTPPTAPTKAPKAAKKSAAPKAEGEAAAPKAPRTSRLKEQYPDDALITVLVDSNPKRGKSKERFEGYTGAKTVADAIKGGVTYADLAWDVGHGLIKVEKAS